MDFQPCSIDARMVSTAKEIKSSVLAVEMSADPEMTVVRIGLKTESQDPVAVASPIGRKVHGMLMTVGAEAVVASSGVSEKYPAEVTLTTSGERGETTFEKDHRLLWDLGMTLHNQAGWPIQCNR